MKIPCKWGWKHLSSLVEEIKPSISFREKKEGEQIPYKKLYNEVCGILKGDLCSC